MSKLSKFIKLDKDVLMEYVYNDTNLINDRYKILTDTRTRTRSYIAADTSTTGNTSLNTIINLDFTGTRYGVMNPDYYSYQQVSDYASGTPTRHDTIKIHLPINWNFGEYIGFYMRSYVMDATGSIEINLSNFFFDMTDSSQQYLMKYSAPPLLFQEKLWGKAVVVEIPSAAGVSSQLANGEPKPNSINQNLSGGLGLSPTSPIFIDFVFIGGKQTINGIKSYTLGDKLTTSVPQTPEYEDLAVKVQHSKNGDYFEIFGTFNENITEFKKFLDDSYRMGQRYYIEYSVTMFEQNVRGKTITFTVTEGFNETIDYRPIIKYSTTTAIIDVEMRLIDDADKSTIIRRASYGMLQDEVSKYSMNLTKINLENANKPKIYNIKNSIDASLLGKTNALGLPNASRGRTGIGYKKGPAFAKGASTGNGNAMGGIGTGGNTTTVVKEPYPVLVEKFNVIGKSDNVIINNNLFFGEGKMVIKIYPFDNILKFVIATGDSTAPNYLDMSGLGEIKIVFKNDSAKEEFPIMTQSNEINTAGGVIVFKIPESRFLSIKKIFSTGNNIFYITATNAGGSTQVYNGLYQIYDTTTNIGTLNNATQTAAAATTQPTTKTDPNYGKETATVTYKQVTQSTTPNKKP